MYQRKVDVDMLNAAKSVLADVWSISPLSEQGLALILYFTLIISQPKKYIQIHIHKKKTKMQREGQKQEQVPLQMATMYDKYTKNSKLKV